MFHLYFYKTFLEVTSYNTFLLYFYKTFLEVTSYNTFRLYFYKTFLEVPGYNTFHLYFYKTFLEVTGYNMFSSLFLQNFSWKVTSSNTIHLYFYKTFLETLSVTIRSVSIFTKFFLEGNWFQYIPSLIFTKFSWKLTGSNMFRLYNSYVRLFNLLSFSWHRIYLSVFLIPVCLTLNFYAGFYS